MRSSSGQSKSSKTSEIRPCSRIILLLGCLSLFLDLSESFATSSCRRCRCTSSSPSSLSWRNPTIQQYSAYDCMSLVPERKSNLRSPRGSSSTRLFASASNSGSDESNQQQHSESSSSSSLSRKLVRKQYSLFSTAIKSLRGRAHSIMRSLRLILGKGQMILKRLKKPLVVISAVIMILTTRTPPAQAKFGHEINEGDKVYSIRPGATQAQASQLLEGEVPEELEDSTGIPSSTTTTATTPKKQESESSKKKASTFDYGDEDDEEDDFLFLEENEKDLRKAPSSRMGTRASAISSSSGGVGSTKAQFTGMSGGKSKSLYAKVSIGLFIPTWGAMGVREFVRRRKEEKYVQKGLEILEQQKKEYFGDDSTDEEDDDDDDDEDEEDEDGDDDDDDDDDEEDDDDDDDDEITPPPKGGPKKPKPPSSGGSGGNDPGYGRASDDDIKKLGNLFDKS